METGEHGDDVLLGRLSEAAGDDVALRQLRRRYEHLRREYEHLLDRLGDIEERLHEPVATVPAAEPTKIPAALDAAIVDPLIRLRAEYVGAAARIQGIIIGLERVAAGAMKGQHGARDRTAVAPSPDPAESGVQPEPESATEPTPAQAEAEEGEEPRPRKVSVEVHGKGFGELLDFQEKLSSVAGVSRVSINAIDAERATLIVELHGGESTAE